MSRYWRRAAVLAVLLLFGLALGWADNVACSGSEQPRHCVD